MLTVQERQFILNKIADGLTDLEVCRQVFRVYGFDLSAARVSQLRKAVSR